MSGRLGNRQMEKNKTENSLSKDKIATLKKSRLVCVLSERIIARRLEHELKLKCRLA